MDGTSPLGWEAMSIRDAFPTRALRARCALISFLVCVICLNLPAEAGPGGGHGGFGGGHFGGGHSGHAHAARSGNSGGHRHWMKLGLGKKSAPTTADASGTQPRWWNFNSAAPSPTSHRMPSTLLWSPLRGEHGVPFISVASASAPHFHQNVYFHPHRPFASSGCFFNGMTQVCFLEPFLPLLGFGYFGYGEGYGGDWDNGGNLAGMDEAGMTQPVPPEDNPPSANENSAAWDAAGHAGASEDRDLGTGVFVLVLRNGTTHAVTNYWVADGYLEYVCPDGTRSHVPLDALDLQSTVLRNEVRGLPFVLRTMAEP
jgi:hypothetical protein